MISEKTTYTTQEAAELLGLNPETIRRKLRKGELKGARTGKEYTISKADLEDWYRRNGGGKLFTDINTN